jgi:leucyl aminopeptidase (aminopeptidase T)
MTKAEAQATYKKAWLDWCIASYEDKRIHEQVMDAVQQDCTDSGRPGPEWEAFIDTLPGYREHWEGTAKNLKKMIEILHKAT